MKKVIQVKSCLRSLIPLVIIAFFLNNFVSIAQTNTLYFQDEFISFPKNIDTFKWSQMPENSKYDGGYFGWIQFTNTPTQDIQNQYVSNGMKLIEYYPDKTYLFYFPATIQISYLQQTGAISIIPVQNNFKKASKIKFNTIGEWAIQEDKILLTLIYHNFIDRTTVFSGLKKINNLLIRKDFKGHSRVEIAIPYNEIDALVSLPFVKWIEPIAPPITPEDNIGRGLHRASNLDTQIPTGRNYTGDGVGVLARDFGIVGPHIDFQGRLDNTAASGGTDHEDTVAGIFVGAGNLDPTKRGMAAGSDFYSSNAEITFLDTETIDLINNNLVQITNNSFGAGCNTGYTINARTVDMQIHTNPSLLHVFSAGNSGPNSISANCSDYGAGEGWATITGGSKQGKNVIAVANANFDGQLSGISSRGPATDGRIKPDITGFGTNVHSTGENNSYNIMSGTSFSAPAIAGISAQLYEAYADANGGSHPESALIKAAMLNTANDYGNVGPDYSFGWGIINGLRAAMLIEEGRYLDATITQGGSNNHSISVPANTTQVRFMVYWSDAAAAEGAVPALVNDLDLVVTDPGNTTHQPWVLNPTPDPALLDAPATTGVDRLNNVEQVLINNPTAGIYNINIAGFNVPMGPQKYYVVYEIITDGITLTYPVGGERFTPGMQEVIYWDATNLNGMIDLEYSTDNGSSWMAISTVAATNRSYNWTIPNAISGECLVRVSNGSLSDQSSGNFSIANRVSGITITEVCPTQATVTWDAVTDATSYDVYVLGTKYMELIGNSTTTSHTFDITNADNPIWVAVSASGGNGWSSLRSNAINHPGGLLNCPLDNDLSVSEINNTASNFFTICNANSIIASATIINNGLLPQANFTIAYQVGSDPIVEEIYTETLAPGASIMYNFNTPISLDANGSNTLKIWTSLAVDEFTNNDEKELNFFGQLIGTPVDFLEPFDTNGVFPLGWSFENPDNDKTWTEATNIIGPDGNPTVAAFIDGANYPTRGQEDTFTTEYFDLNFTGTARLNFDIAKAQWADINNDALRIEVSTDCGMSYTEIYFKDGLDLATVPYINSAWTPSGESDWRKETISLNAFIGNNILVKFVNVNDFSNNTFIDNIEVIKTSSTNSDGSLESAISMFPNPSQNDVHILIETIIESTYEIQIFNTLGQLVTSVSKTPFKNRAEENINITKFDSGLYFVKIKVDNQEVTKKLVVN